MENYYDWDKNIIHVCDTLGNIFEFALKDNIVIVDGASGTGKSMFTSIVQVLISDNNKNTAYKLHNVIVIDRSNKQSICNQKNKLIVIDRADIVFDDIDTDIIAFINADRLNRYLIFARGYLDIAVSPNYYATIIRQDNKFILKYAYNVKGWN